MTFWTECFGLHVRSEIDLLGSISTSQRKPDIRVTVERKLIDLAPAHAAQWGRDSEGCFSWAIIPGIARLKAHDNGHVRIEIKKDVDKNTIRTIVTTVALPLALQALPGLLLEASAIRWQGQCLLMLGRGYCGKSTLASLMADLGAELIADSHCFVRLSERGDLSVCPALPHVRLWPQQATLLGPSWPSPKLLRPGLSKQLYVVPEFFHLGPCTIKGFILMRRGIDNQFHQHRLSIKDRLQAIATANARLRTDSDSMHTLLRHKLMIQLAGLPVCDLMQWPRNGQHELETRSRLQHLMAAYAWGAIA